MCTTKNKNTILNDEPHPITHLIVFPMYYSNNPLLNHVKHPVDKRWYYKPDPNHPSTRLEGPAVLWKNRDEGIGWVPPPLSPL